MNFSIANMKSLPTTIVGILGFLAMLPQNPTVQQIMSISPTAAKWITGIGAVATGLVLIFGTGSVGSAKQDTGVQDGAAEVKSK